MTAATVSHARFADLAARALLKTPIAGVSGQVTREFRTKGFERFSAVGFPTTKDEDWRFTPLRDVVNTHFGAAGDSPVVSEADIAPYLFGLEDNPLVVIVDGRVDRTLSRMGLKEARGHFVSMADATDASVMYGLLGKYATVEMTPLVALNAALFTDGLFLHMDGHESRPIHILHVATSAANGAILSPRHLIVLEDNASATIVESFVALTDEPYFTNACTEIKLSSGSRLEHIRIQRESRAAHHIGATAVSQPYGSHYRSFALALGGKLSRHDLQTRLNAPSIETLLYGLYLGRGEQLMDNHTTIFHDQPNCNSWEVYKGVLAESSRAVFNGKVIVQPAAQKTDAKQTNRNLLLSDDARVDTKPQLEIFADDVKCTHGATVGRLDAQQRYYLQTRGIAGRTAQALLIWAFVAEVLQEIVEPDVRAALETVVHAELDALIAR